MLKTLPGNDELFINIATGDVYKEGEIIELSSNEDKSLNVNLYGKDFRVTKEWLALYAKYEITIPCDRKEQLVDLRFVDHRIPRRKEEPIIKIPVFGSPIEKDGFRLISVAPRYEVSKEGVFRNVKTKRELKITSGVDGYLFVDGWDPELNGYRSMRAHKLYAIAWKENDNYVLKCVVNHINGDKSKLSFDNLEWTTYKGNADHAFETGLRNDNIPVRLKDHETGEVSEFYSMTKLNESYPEITMSKIRSYINRPVRNRLLLNRYEVVLSDEDFEENIAPVSSGRYVIKVSSPNGDQTFTSVSDLIKHFKLWNMGSTSIARSIEVMKTKYPELEVTYTDSFVSGEVDVLTISTGTIKTYANFAEAGRGINLNRSIVRRMCDTPEVSRKGYAFRLHSKEKWCEIIKEIGTSKSIIVKNVETGVTTTYPSMRKAAASLKLDRTTISERIKHKKVINNILIQFG